MMDKNKEQDAQDETNKMQDVTIDAETGEVEAGKEQDDCTCTEEALVSEDVTVDLSEEVDLAFGGEEGLNEEVKEKVKTILEAAVSVKVKEEIARINEEAQEAFQIRLAEMEENIDEKIDAYLQEYVIPKWVEDNKVALEVGIKNKIAENLVTDLKALLESYNINLTQEEADELDEAAEIIEGLKSELNEAIDALAEANKEINQLKKDKILDTLSEGLALTQVEKFNTLVSELSTDDLEVFERKAKILRDSLFEKVETKEKQTVEKVMENVGVDPVMSKLLEKVKKQNVKD